MSGLEAHDDSAYQVAIDLSELDERTLHAGLNDEQYAAATAVEGPVIVVAGAGAGKTKTLIHRVAELLRRGIPPVNLMVVTFTNDAAREIRERLAQMVGPEAEHITAGTLHSVIFRNIIRAFPESQTLGRLGIDAEQCTILDEGDAGKLQREALELLPEALRQEMEDNEWTLAQFKKTLSMARARGEDVYAFAAGISPRDEQANYHKLVARFWAHYTDLCRQHHGIDFDDILVVARQMLREERGIARQLGERFRYLMLDEYQDTNPVQMAIMDAIAERHRNIFVVGDEKQSIYRFRGADINVILSFKHRYPEAVQIDMKRNYRSQPEVIATINALASAMPRKLSDGQLIAEARLEEAPVSVVGFESARAEARTVRRAIERDMRRGTPGEQIAVLYRARSLKGELERELVENDIPYEVIGDTGFYQRQEIRDAVALLRFAFQPWDSLAGARVLRATRMGVSEQAARKAMQKDGTPVKDLLADHASRTLKGAKDPDGNPRPSATARKVAPFLKVCQGLREAVRYEDPPAMVREVLDRLWRTYCLPSLEAAARRASSEEGAGSVEQRTQNVSLLLDRLESGLERGEDIATVIENLTLATNSRHELDEDRAARVKLMTMHASKGLQFGHVYVIGCDDHALPGVEDDAEIDEARRTLYVALSRAERRLAVSYSLVRQEFGRTIQVQGSRFIQEILEHHPINHRLVRESERGARPRSGEPSTPEIA